MLRVNFSRATAGQARKADRHDMLDLIAKTLKQALELRRARGLGDGRMKIDRLTEDRRICSCFGGDRRVVQIVGPSSKLGHQGRRRLLGSPARRNSFQRRSDRIDLTDFLRRRLPDDGRLVGLTVDQALLFELQQRLADRRATDRQLSRQYVFVERLPWPQGSIKNRVSKDVRHGIA